MNTYCLSVTGLPSGVSLPEGVDSVAVKPREEKRTFREHVSSSRATKFSPVAFSGLNVDYEGQPNPTATFSCVFKMSSVDPGVQAFFAFAAGLPCAAAISRNSVPPTAPQEGKTVFNCPADLQTHSCVDCCVLVDVTSLPSVSSLMPGSERDCWR